MGSDAVSCTNDLNIEYSNATGTYHQHYILVETPLGDRLTFTPNPPTPVLNFQNVPLVNDPDVSSPPVQYFVVTNNGYLDPRTPAGTDPTGVVHLQIVTDGTANSDPGNFSFTNPNGSLSTTKTVTLPRVSGTAPYADVAVYYVPYFTGTQRVTSGDPGASHAKIIWSVDGGEPVCMCASDFTHSTCASGLTAGTAATLEGNTTKGDVASVFSPSGDFGAVFCGAAGGVKSFVISNTGTAEFHITNFTLAPKGSTLYFQLADESDLPITLPLADPILVTPPGLAYPSRIFHVIALPIDHNLTHADLSDLNKFSASLSFTTDVFGDPNGRVAADISMTAKGVIIQPGSLLSTWTFSPVNWPSSTDSTFHTPVDNQGNVNGQATLIMTPGDGGPTDDKFTMISPPNVLNPTTGGIEPELHANFGSFPLLPCNRNPETHSNVDGTIVITVDPPITSTTGVGICQSGWTTTVDGYSAWTEAIKLNGVLNVATTGRGSCVVGQYCSDGDGNCYCGTSSCPNGCCTSTTAPNGACVFYSDEGPTQCGTLGAVCGTCTDGNCTSTAGACVCSGAKPDLCSGACTNRQTDSSNCGTCGNECVSGTSCVGSSCTCNATSCPNGCCGADGACHTPSAPGTCGIAGAACTDCTLNTVSHEIACNGSGVCACETGKTLCEGVCTDTLTDDNNCGGCNTLHTASAICNSDQHCVAGQCTCNASSCPSGCCTAGVGGSCAGGTVNTQCGAAGAICISCATAGSGRECVGTTGGGQCTCDATSCPTGCCASGLCHVLDNFACGFAGLSCTDCAALSSPATGQTCQAGGSCGCKPTELNCGGVCTDVTNDGHCASCSEGCPGGQHCSTAGSIHCEASGAGGAAGGG
jgi:hypothetical protein